MTAANHLNIVCSATEPTDEMVVAAKAGDPNAVDALIRAYFPMIQRMAASAASRQFPAEADRRADLVDELISCGMEVTWSLISSVEGDTIDGPLGFGGYLRTTVAKEMQRRLREALYGIDDPDGRKRFGAAIRAAAKADESGAMEFEDLVDVAADLVTKLDPKRRLSRAHADAMRLSFLDKLSIDHAVDTDNDEDPAALVNLASTSSLFGNGLGRAEEEQAANSTMMHARSARVRYLLDQMENRSPVRAVAVKATYGIDGHPVCATAEDLADYMHDLSPEFADVDARSLQRRHLPRGKKTLESQWLRGVGAADSVESLAIELGLEDD